MPPRQRLVADRLCPGDCIGCSMSVAGCWMFFSLRSSRLCGLFPCAPTERTLISTNALGFLPAPPNLLTGKWLSNPNGSSTRKSCASRCGPSSCPSEPAPGSPNSRNGPFSSHPAVRTTSKKPPCSGRYELLRASETVGRALTNQFYARYADIRQRVLKRLVTKSINFG
jgi:hypothetical protein